MTRKNFSTRAPAAMELAALARTLTHHVLRLYVAGTTPRCIRAISNIRAICDEHLGDRYELEIIDIAQQPSLAQSEQIIAAPTLIRILPLPLRRFIGDLSDTDRIAVGLDLARPSGHIAHRTGS